MTLVMKFGGTSVGSAAAMRNTAALIRDSREAWGTVVVVVSAMGSKPTKVTDLLLQGAHKAMNGNSHTYKETAAALRQVHYEAIDGLLSSEDEREQILDENNRFIDHYEALCEAVLVLGELTPRALDAISGMGEQMSARIMAAYLRQVGLPARAVDATRLIVTDSAFQAAVPLYDQTRACTEAVLRPLLAQDGIPVVTGFIGATENGITTTLGRGGSDYSAAILGKVLDAAEVWIWTDVDGVMTADPRITPDARSIPVLTYREVSELAYYGAKVLHPKSIRPCVENGIPLRIKNTFNPDHPGTVIVGQAAENGGGIRAVTAIDGLSLVTVEGKGMIGVQGIAARTFGAVAASHTSVLLISQASSEQSICFSIPDDAAPNVIAALETEFAVELQRRDIDRIWDEQPVSIVTAVGANLRATPGIAGLLFGALGRHQINIIAIAQGSSECSISLVVSSTDAGTAVARIHELIVATQPF